MRIRGRRLVRSLVLLAVLGLGTSGSLLAKEVPLQSPIFRSQRLDYAPADPFLPPYPYNPTLNMAYVRVGPADANGDRTIVVFNDPCSRDDPGIFFLHLSEGGSIQSTTGVQARATCDFAHLMGGNLFTAGDFDGNGLTDFASWGSHTLFLQQPGERVVEVPFSLPLDPVEGYPQGVYLVSGDLNQDGIPDVVIAQEFLVVSNNPPDFTYRDSTDLTLFLADGHGGFVRSQKITALAVPGQDFKLLPAALADFTGDGIPDYLGYGSAPAGAWEILPGDGAGHLLTPDSGIPTSLPPTDRYGTFPYSVAGSGDLNGDGLADLVLKDQGGSPYVALSAGIGYYPGPQRLSLPPSSYWHTVDIEDVDGDALPDIQLLGHGFVATYRGTGDGVQTAPLQQKVPIDPQGSLRMRWDEDPLPDLVFYGEGIPPGPGLLDHTLSLSVFLSPAGLARDQIEIPRPWSGAYPLAAGDFDGDGEQDLLFAGNGHRVVLYRGNGHGGFLALPDAAAPPGGGITGALAADFNHDGRDDIVVLSAPATAGGSGSVTLYLGQPPGQPPALLLTKAAGGSPIKAAAADLNGDGNLDLLVADKGAVRPGCAGNCYFGGKVSAYLGLGGGGLGDPRVVIDSDPPGLLPGIADIEAGRVNGDAIPDLLILFSTFALYDGTTGAWADGRGDGGFDGPYTLNRNVSVLGTIFPLPPPADVNGDGLPDAGMSLVTLSDFGHPQFGTFLGHTEEDLSRFGIASPCCIDPGQFVDLDRDGFLDLVGADLASDHLQYGAGTGTGSFPTRDPLYAAGGLRLMQADGNPPPRITPAPLFADFNDDGRTDLVVWDAIGIHLLLNRSNRVASDPAESLQDPAPGAHPVDPQIDLTEIQARVGSYDFSGVGIPQGALVFTLSLNDLPPPADSGGETVGDRNAERDGGAPARGENVPGDRPGPVFSNPGWRSGRPSLKSGRFQIFLNFGEPLEDSDGDGRLDLSIANATQEPGLAGIPLADVTLNLNLDGGGPPFTGLHNLGKFSTVDRERGIATFVVAYADLLSVMTPAERSAMDQGDGTGRLFLWAVSRLYGDQDRVPDTNDGGDPTIRSEVREFRFPLKDLRIASALTFGDVLLTTHRDGPLTFANHGVDTVTVETAGFPDPALSLLPSPPFGVPGGGRSQAALRYAPAQHARFSGDVTVQADDPGSPTVSMRSSGRGVAPVAQVTPESIPFGSVPQGLASAGTGIRINNAGDTALDFTWEILDPYDQYSVSMIPYSLYPPPTSASIPPGSGVTWYVSFHPNQLGPSQGTFRMTTNDPFHPQIDVSLTGTATPPEPRISVGYGCFDTGITGVPLGGEGSVSCQVSNVGSAPLAILSVTSTDPSFSAAVNPPTIPPGGAGTLTVTYRPTAWGLFTTDITVNCDDPTNPTVTGRVNGQAFEPPPQGHVAPTTLDFGTLGEGQSVTRSFDITNTGAGPLRLVGPNPLIQSYCMTQTDLAIPSMVLPGETLTAHVTLTPDINKAFCGSFSIDTNDPALYELTITIQASLLWPSLIYQPSSLTFAYTLVGASTTLPITVENHGTAPLRIIDASFGSPSFGLGGPLPEPIPPGGGATIPISFAPGGVGTSYSYLNFSTNDPSHRSVTIYLSGTGYLLGSGKAGIDLNGH